MPRQHVENTKEFCGENEANRANKHANKRIIYWPPFWNKVYTNCLVLRSQTMCEKKSSLRVFNANKSNGKVANNMA